MATNEKTIEIPAEILKAKNITFNDENSNLGASDTQAAIDATVKKAEVISADVTAVSKKIDNQIVVTTKPILENSKAGGIKFRNIYGKSKHGSTTGAQLLPNGLSLMDNGNYITSGEITLPAGSYTFSAKKTNSTSFYYWINVNGSSVVENTTSANTFASTFTLTEESTVQMSGRYNPTAPINLSDFTEAMLNVGTEPLPWEPYTGGKPSPNPEYKQEVVSVGNGGSVEGKVCGKNFLKYNRTAVATTNGVTFTVNEDKSVTVNGTASEDIRYTLRSDFVFKKGFAYTTSGCPSGGSTSTYYFAALGIDVGNGVTREATKDTVIWVQIHIKSGTVCNNLVFKPMIRLASIEDDTYEPYQEQTLTLQTPNGLPGIPLGTTIPDVIKNSPIHMSGVYWDDEEGQYYIADTVDGVNGVKVQRVGVLVFDGSKEWSTAELGDGWYRHSIAQNTFNPEIESALSNQYKLKLHYKEQSYHFYVQEGIWVFNQMPHDEFLAQLAETNLVVIGVLATPIETPLSEEDILALHSLRSYDTVTHIINDSEVKPVIEATYGITDVAAVGIENSNLVKINNILINNRKVETDDTLSVEGVAADAKVVGEEINTLKKSVSDGKTLVAEAITEKRVETATDASFEIMAENIAKIVLGSGNAAKEDVLTGKTFTNDDGVEYTGTMANNGAWTGSTNGDENVTIPEGYHNGNGYVSGKGAYDAGYSAGENAGYNSGYSAGKGSLSKYSKNRHYLGVHEDEDNNQPSGTASTSVNVPANSTCYIIASVSNHPENGAGFTNNCILTLNALSCSGATITTLYESVQQNMSILRVYKVVTGSGTSASISAIAGGYYTKYVDLRLVCLA